MDGWTDRQTDGRAHMRDIAYMLSRAKSRTERSMNDAHNCPKNLTKIHIQIT